MYLHQQDQCAVMVSLRSQAHNSFVLYVDILISMKTIKI